MEGCLHRRRLLDTSGTWGGRNRNGSHYTGSQCWRDQPFVLGDPIPSQVRINGKGEPCWCYEPGWHTQGRMMLMCYGSSSCYSPVRLFNAWRTLVKWMQCLVWVHSDTIYPNPWVSYECVHHIISKWLSILCNNRKGLVTPGNVYRQLGGFKLQCNVIPYRNTSEANE